MLLGYSLTPFGHDPDAWRQAPDSRHLGFHALLDQVAVAEAAGVDFFLLADRLGLRPKVDLSPLAVPFEPTLLASALATRVADIGIIAAASTMQHEPYNLARRFASLDLLSKGRSGWMVIPSDGDTGRESEYLELVTALWDSFEDDAFQYDKAGGRFFDPGKMHVAHHEGTHFSVRGPLNVNRSPQGRPVIAHLLNQAGDALAVRTGEVLLLQANSPEQLIEMAARVLEAAEVAGRRRADIRLLANIIPFVMPDLADDDWLAQPIEGIKVTGAPDLIVGKLQELMAAARLDGFTILAPTLEMGRRFISDVVPQLKRHEPGGKSRRATLREKLGLSRPRHPASLEREMRQ